MFRVFSEICYDGIILWSLGLALKKHTIFLAAGRGSPDTDDSRDQPLIVTMSHASFIVTDVTLAGEDTGEGPEGL